MEKGNKVSENERVKRRLKINKNVCMSALPPFFYHHQNRQWKAKQEREQERKKGMRAQR
jgi:hypothetical protein